MSDFFFHVTSVLGATESTVFVHFVMLSSVLYVHLLLISLKLV